MLLSSMLPAPLKPASTLSRTWRRVTIHWQQEKESTEIDTYPCIEHVFLAVISDRAFRRA
jgi:hypothetical protein